MSPANKYQPDAQASSLPHSVQPNQKTLPAHRLLQVLDQGAATQRPRLLVLGDLILDQYTFGEAARVSQEAPILVLRATEEEQRLGGAANVANMARALGAEVICAGVVGTDAAAKETIHLLQAADIECWGLIQDSARPTTVKQRFVGRTDGRNAHQMLRVDREVHTPLSRQLEDTLARNIEQRLMECDGLLISDYGKGVCTRSLLARVITAARRLRKPVLVDPLRAADYARYRGATLLKPNRSEASLATSVSIESSSAALIAAQRLCEDLDLQSAIITLDRDGMAYYHREHGGALFPTHARNVYDITGAGDMVLAALGVFLCGGAQAEDAIHLANLAAGLEVEQIGVVTVSRQQLRAHLTRHMGGSSKILDLESAAELASQYRMAGKRIVFTNGCYDLLHAGHVLSLTMAAAEGDILYVGVNGDDMIRQLKGPQRPIIGQQDRMAVLAALSCVDHVILFHEETPHALLQAIRPDVLVKGGTYSTDQVVGREVVEAYGGVVRVTPIVEGLSTSKIVESVLQRSAA